MTRGLPLIVADGYHRICTICYFDESAPIPSNRNRWSVKMGFCGSKRSILSTLMFAVSSSRHKNALLARERFRMATTEQGRRHDHQNDG
jgi:hypothetical protein